MENWNPLYLLVFVVEHEDGRVSHTLEAFFYKQSAIDRGHQLARKHAQIDCRFKVYKFKTDELVHGREYGRTWPTNNWLYK